MDLKKEELFIVEKMIEGDVNAFKYFFDTYYSDLCNFVNIYVRNEQVAEEIVQDIFVYFWENREKLKLFKSVKSYFFTASKNRSLNYLRDQRTGINYEQQISDFSLASDEKTEQHLEMEELRSLLSKAIDTLPDKCQEIYKLSRDEELSNKEIAEKLDISVKTVENQMTIALKRIRNYLKPYNDKIFMAFLIFLMS